MRINDEQARTFYMEECAKAAWSVRQLERQINTMYYQRILASQDKTAVAKEIQTTEPKPEYEKIVKDPFRLLKAVPTETCRKKTWSLVHRQSSIRKSTAQSV